MYGCPIPCKLCFVCLVILNSGDIAISAVKYDKTTGQSNRKVLANFTE